MKVLGSVILVYVILTASDGNLIEIRENLYKEISIAVRLVEDIVQARPDENKVLIGDRKSLSQLSTVGTYLVKNFTVTFITILTSEMVTERTIKALTDVNLKDNKPNIFITIVSKEISNNSLAHVISTIRKVDYESRIVVINSTKTDLEQIYQNIYNVYWFTSDDTQDRFKSETLYRMMHICRFCKNGQDEVRQVNSWRYSKGFRHQLRFPMSFKSNFFGSKLIMGTDWWLAHINAQGYTYIGNILNLTWEFRPASDGSTWIFESFLADLENGSIDVIGTGWLFVYERYKMADVSTGEFYYSGYSVISVEPKIGLDDKALITVFHWYTWLFLVLMILSSAVTLYVCREYGRFPDREGNFWECLWEICVVLFWDVVRIRQAPLPILFIFMAHILGSFIIVSLYFAQYTAIATNQKYLSPPVDTLEQFFKSDLQWISGYEPDIKFIVSTFSHVKNFENRHINFSHVKGENPYVTALKEVMKNPQKLVFINTVVDSKYFIEEYGLEDEGLKYYFSKEKFREAFDVLYYRKGCYYKEAFDRAILWAHALGLVSYHESSNSMSFANKKAQEKPKPVIKLEYIGLKHLRSPFQILGWLYVSSAIICCLEILVNRLTNWISAYIANFIVYGTMAGTMS